MVFLGIGEIYPLKSSGNNGTRFLYTSTCFITFSDHVSVRASSKLVIVCVSKGSVSQRWIRALVGKDFKGKEKTVEVKGKGGQIGGHDSCRHQGHDDNGIKIDARVE